MRYQTRQMKKIDYKSKHINEISNLQTSILQKFNWVKKKTLYKALYILEFHLNAISLPIAAAIGKIMIIECQSECL
jgi:hypothetical protein